MSPLLRNRLSVAICPTQISITPIQRGWKPQVSKTIVIDVPPESGVDGWKPSLDALTEWLRKNEVTKVDMVIAISGSLARYALLPWMDKGLKRSELLTLTRVQFESLYGEPALNWAVVAEQGEYGKPRIACAIDQGFIAGIEEVCKTFKIKLRSLQPYFISAFNHWRHQIGEQGMLCIVESDSCIFSSLKNGRWNSIRNVVLKDVLKADIQKLCEREMALQGISNQGSMFLHSPNSEILAKYSAARNLKILVSGNSE